MTDGSWRLPTRWRLEKLREACEINPRRPLLSRSDQTPTSFVRMSSVDEETGTIPDLQLRPFIEVKKGYTYFGEGDVLFAKITPCMQNGKATIARGLTDGIGFGSTEFHVLRPKDDVLSEWIFYFVRQQRFREEAQRKFRGAVGQQRVPEEFLEEYSIPVPPTIDDQRRIVAKIEALFDRIREAKRLRAEANKDGETVKDAAVVAVFKEGRRRGWPTKTVGEVIVGKPQYGTSQKATEEPEGIPILRMSNIVDGRILFDELKYLKLAPQEARKYFLNQGDILFNRTNSAELVGKSAVFSVGQKAVFASYLIRIVPDSEKALPEFLVAYMNSSFGREYFQAQLTRAIGQVNINAKKLQAMPVPVPSVEEQREVVTYLKNVAATAQTLTERHAETDAELKRLEQSILDRAFRGEL